MLGEIGKFGNSACIIIPVPLLSQCGLAVGDSVEVTVEAGRLVIERTETGARAGWADDAKRMAAAGDDALVWQGLPHDADDDLRWETEAQPSKHSHPRA